MDNIASEPQNIERSEGGAPATPAGAGSSWEGRLLQRVLRAMHEPPIEFVLEWSGERVAPQARKPIAHVRLSDRRMLWNLLRNPQVTLGDAYSAGRVELDCDIVQFLDLLYLNELQRGPAPVATTRRRAPGPRRNTLAGSRDNIHRHYDIGNDFYSLWLGQTMAYTCAYYPTESASLDQAQIAKMDHVCRKLRLRAGDTVVEAGCGWGSLALHMAQHYGAKVRAFNISREQIAYARSRLAERGLSERVEFVEDDYRNITGRYDVFVSVGMLEHVGPENYREFGRDCAALPAPRWPGADPFDRPQLARPAASLGRTAHLPGSVSTFPRRNDGRSSSPPTCRCSTSRTCGCTTRGRCSTGWSCTRRRCRRVRAHVRRDLRAQVAAVPRRVDGRVPDRHAAAVPGAVLDDAEQRPAPHARVHVPALTRQLMRSAEVIVVGGGPAGSAAAQRLVRAGVDVLVLDRERFPRPKLCAGWITPEVLQDLALDPADYPHGFLSFRRLHFHLKALHLPVQALQHSIRRFEFDAWLLERSRRRTVQHTVTPRSRATGRPT